MCNEFVPSRHQWFFTMTMFFMPATGGPFTSIPDTWRGVHHFIRAATEWSVPGTAPELSSWCPGECDRVETRPDQFLVRHNPALGLEVVGEITPPTSPRRSGSVNTHQLILRSLNGFSPCLCSVNRVNTIRKKLQKHEAAFTDNLLYLQICCRVGYPHTLWP